MQNARACEIVAGNFHGVWQWRLSASLVGCEKYPRTVSTGVGYTRLARTTYVINTLHCLRSACPSKNTVF